MRTTVSVAAIVALLVAGAASAQTADPAALADRVQTMAIEANLTGDDDAFREAAALAERGLTLHPDEALLHHYHGYALYRLASRHACDEAAEPGCAQALLERAEAALQASLAAEPLAETYALLGSIYGLMIGESPALGASLGQRIDELQAKALALDGENPRVWLLKGIGDLFTPEAFGGGVQPAMAALERSAAAYERDASPPPAPRWGRVDVHVWLGQVYHRAGQIERARAEYEKALAIAPEHAWVRDELLPALGGRS